MPPIEIPDSELQALRDALRAREKWPLDIRDLPEAWQALEDLDDAARAIVDRFDGRAKGE